MKQRKIILKNSSSNKTDITLFSSKKGDSATNVIMWMGIVLATIIVSTWFITQLKPVQQDITTIKNDLRELRISLDYACNSIEFTREYNPQTEQGIFFSNITHLCINATTVLQCITPPCTITGNIDEELTTIVTINVEKEMSNPSPRITLTTQ